MSQLLFERSVPGRRCAQLPELDVPEAPLPEALCRRSAPRLPEIAEVDLVRHYADAGRRAFGVCNGFYPLGSCTMKYNPVLHEELAALPGFTDIHPLQPEHTTQGCMEVLALCRDYLCEITGMDDMTFQPAAGAHGEYTGLQVIRAYHLSRGDAARTRVIVPDSAHGTNPASAVMNGFEVVNVPSDEQGNVDLAALRGVLGPDTAALMLTNPNTLGLFETHIAEITALVHEAGGLVYYDGANLNAVMGITRPGDMGFDVIHLNLHKTFATPHGGGGPGSGAVGCKAALSSFLPRPQLVGEGPYHWDADAPQAFGRVKAFYGNFTVCVKTLAYLLSLGAEGVRETSETAVLNANYLMYKLAPSFKVAYPRPCMHEFVLTLEDMKHDHGVSAMDVAKALIDHGIHPPTMYFPLIVHEALMLEPTETESRQTLDEAAAAFAQIYEDIQAQPEALHAAPTSTPIGRPDEVLAARKPVLRYEF